MVVYALKFLLNLSNVPPPGCTLPANLAVPAPGGKTSHGVGLSPGQKPRGLSPPCWGVKSPETSDSFPIPFCLWGMRMSPAVILRLSHRLIVEASEHLFSSFSGPWMKSHFAPGKIIIRDSPPPRLGADIWTGFCSWRRGSDGLRVLDILGQVECILLMRQAWTFRGQKAV